MVKQTTWTEGTPLSRHGSASLEAARPAPESGQESSEVSSGQRSASKRKRGLFRRAGILPPAIGIAAVLVSIVYLASYVTTSNGTGAASMFGAIDGLGHSGQVAVLEQERSLIIEMDAAANTLTMDSKPAMANPAALQQQSAQSEETGGTGVATLPPPASPTTAQADAKAMLASYGWNDTTQWTCLYNLWQRESSWYVYATNLSSGAYGIPQAFPGDKMASAGADWLTNPVTQIKWGLGYIKTTYGTPCSAWSTELAIGAY